MIGDPFELIRELTQDIVAHGVNDINLATLSRRAAILSDSINRKPDDREWQRKIVYTIEELQATLRRLQEGVSPWQDTAGLHLRGFKSHLDGAVSHYRIFIPSTYERNKPMPLAVMAPPALSASCPFLESAFVAKQLDAECLSEVAESLGVAILWPGYSSLPYGNLWEFDYFDEVVADVENNYNIDHKQLYLIGTCHGSMIATMMAEFWPSRFAAVGLLNPDLTRTANHMKDVGDWSNNKSYIQWIEANAPANHLNELIKTPFHIVYDHGDPDHGSLADATFTYNSARKTAFAPLIKKCLVHYHG